MDADRHHHDASGPGEERLRQALRHLAESAGGAPALSGAELRALAGRRRLRRFAAVPAVALAGLLVGTTAYALTGGLAPGPGHSAPPRRVPAPTSAPLTTSPPHASASAAPGGAPAAPGPATTVSPPAVPAATASPRAARPTLPGLAGVAVCPAGRDGETLVSLHAPSAPATLTAGTGTTTDTVLSAVPLSCVRGRLTPSGPLQELRAAADAAVTTTAPLSDGPASTPSTLEDLTVGLARHPDQLFGIRRDASGRVIRLDEVYVP